MTVSEVVAEFVQDVKNDATPTNWAAFSPVGKEIQVVGKASTGRVELIKNFKADRVIYALLRTISGDRESRRTKFVLITWVGSSCSALAKGRASTLKSELLPSVGQYHIEITTDDLGDVTAEAISKKLKAAGGADYDTGSNAGGYKGEGARNIKAKALGTFGSMNKVGNLNGKSPNTSSSTVANKSMFENGCGPKVVPNFSTVGNVKNKSLSGRAFSKARDKFLDGVESNGAKPNTFSDAKGKFSDLEPPAAPESEDMSSAGSSRRSSNESTDGEYSIESVDMISSSIANAKITMIKNIDSTSEDDYIDGDKPAKPEALMQIPVEEISVPMAC